MNITLQYFEACPNWRIAEERLASVVADRPETTVTHQRVGSVEEAERVGFRGSPTILLDGIDPFGQPDVGVGLVCRVYTTPEGLAGAPTVDQLRAVITCA